MKMLIRLFLVEIESQNHIISRELTQLNEIGCVSCTVELLEKSTHCCLYVEILGREEGEEEGTKSSSRNCLVMSTCYVLDNLIGRQKVCCNCFE